MSEVQTPQAYPPELPVGYYLDNFLAILDFVDGCYGDILSPDEKSFSRGFRSLSLDARRLYVRLITRKGPLFRSDNLRYEEIGDIPAAAAELAGCGFLDIDGAWPIGELLALLRKAEIVVLCAGLDRGPALAAGPSALKALRKEELIELASSRLSESALRQNIVSHFHVYFPLGSREVLIYRLLFFGNLYQDLSEFVLTELGLLRYEDYQIRQEDRLFRSRELLERTFRLIELNDACFRAVEGRSVAAIDVKELLSIVAQIPDLGLDAGEPGLRRLHDNLLNATARQLERAGKDEEALALYRQAVLPPSRERQVRILERRRRTEEALLLCRDMLKDPWDEAEAEFAERYSRRLAPALGRPATATVQPLLPVETVLLTRAAEESVEETALRHFQERGWRGFHSENILWTGLFGLAFWDILFLSLPGAFFNRYQRGPRDLFSPEFRRRREAAIRERLARIAVAPSWPQEILATYDRKYGIACDLVAWKYLPRELVELSTRHIPRPHLVEVFDRLSRDPGANKSGFPDLILFPGGRRPKKKGRTDGGASAGKIRTAEESRAWEEQGYQLVEVKGPSDQLQKNQRRWMRHFLGAGIPFRIVRVLWRP